MLVALSEVDGEARRGMEWEGSFPLQWAAPQLGSPLSGPSQTPHRSAGGWPAGVCGCRSVGVPFHRCVPLHVQPLVCFYGMFISISTLSCFYSLGHRGFIGTGWGRGRPEWSWKREHLGTRTEIPVLT